MIVGPTFFSGRPGYDAILLMHFDGDFEDSSRYRHTVTPYGGLVASNSSSLFAGGELTFNGSGWLEIDDADEFDLTGYQAVSIDCWIYIPTSASLAIDNTIASKWATNELSYWLGLGSTGELRLFEGQNNLGLAFLTISPSLSRDAWHHIAWWRTGGISNLNYAAVDGVITYSILGNGFLAQASKFSIGATEGGGAPMPAGVVIKELRMKTNVIDYGTSNFTPPAGPYG